MPPAESIRAAREARGMDQRALADACHTSQATISRLERGAFEPGWPLRGYLARILELPGLLDLPPEAVL